MFYKTYTELLSKEYDFKNTIKFRNYKLIIANIKKIIYLFTTG